MVLKSELNFTEKTLYVQVTKLPTECSIKSIYFIFTFENIFKVC